MTAGWSIAYCRAGGAGGAGGAGSAGGGAAAAGAAAGAAAWSLNEIATGSRSPGSSISKNSREVKPPLEATTEFGKTWIFVL
jgi:hypothetical protein